MAQRQCIQWATSASSTAWRSASRTPSSRIVNTTTRHRRPYSIPTTTRTPTRQQEVLLPRNRKFTTSSTRLHNDLIPPTPGNERSITFIDKDLHRTTFTVADGNNLLDIAQAHDLEMEVEGEGMYDKMEEPSDDENDMLDLAFGLTETSRLGCQVSMRKELDGLVVRLPSMTRNMQASDFAEKEKKSG
ncbi:mitochondrial matrix iron-sulfur protein [Recurvomyces mirabilis]|nr:mitochondrial matrix iron-sulfur protein [Recurvomyces mirabilis]